MRATPHPGAVAEDGAPSSPGSSSPRSSVASSARDDAASEAAEDAASVAFLRAVHVEYLSGNYTSLELDCLFKVQVPVGCLRDWSAGAGGPDGGSSAEVPRLFLISSAAASVVPVPLLPLLPLGDPPIVLYAPGANLYVAGEVYAPLAASIGFRRSAAKKLLQTERLLQFLTEKEGADDVCNCALVFVLMGPHTDAEMGATLFLTLEHYQRVLPCTWALQRAGRLLGLRVAGVSAAVGAAQSSWAIADLRAEVAGLRAEVAGLRAEMHDGFDRLARLITASLARGAV